jgi:hypothetical protein
METIKIARWSLAVLFFIGLLGESSNAFEPSNTAKGAKGIILKEEYVPGSYCHQKLPAINVNSIAGDHPVLNQTDIIDVSGPCNQNPLGTDQVAGQKRADSDKQSH